MKKLLKVFSLCLAWFVLFSGFSSAADDCIRQNVWDNSVCVSIEKWSNNKYTVDGNVKCRDDYCAVSCEILLPDNTLQKVWACNWKFTYNSSAAKKIKVYVTINNEWKSFESYYHFGKGYWVDGADWSGESDGDLTLSTNNKKLSTSDYVRLTIKAEDNYRGNIDLSAKYRASSSDPWKTISNSSSTYFSNISDERDNGYYKMTSSDDGEKTISKLLKFTKKWYYRIFAEDKYGNSSYVEFNVWWSSSSSNEIELSASTTSPKVWNSIKLTVETDYVGTIYFDKVQYRSSNSNSWSSISRTSSSYFSDYSSVRDDGEFRIKSSDNGKKTLSNLVEFAKKGYYRIYVKDGYDNSSYIDFNVWTSSSSSNSDEIELTASTTSPKVWNSIKLTINTNSNYVGDIVFEKVQYRSSNSASWSNVSRTNTSYFSDYSSERDDGEVVMKSSDKWKKIISSFLEFAKKWYYRIYAKDVDWNSTYIDFNVWTSSSSSSDEITLSASNTSPKIETSINLTVKTDYIGTIYFDKVQYRSSNSNSWSTVSRASYTYFSDYSSIWDDGEFSIKSSDNWKKTLSNLVEFAKKGYYRIYVKDGYDNSSYIDFNVWTSSSSSSSDDLGLSTNSKNPSTSDYVRLTISTDSSYRGNIDLSAKYRASSSDSWKTISNSSSTYFSNISDEWDNGYYKMTSSDNGEKTISKMFKFAKKGYYRIFAEDRDGNSNYIDFNVWTSSSSNNVEISTNDKKPSTSDYVRLTVNTDSSYRGKVNFSAKYRSSTSNSWTDVSRTSSTYFTNRSTTWANGYITMTSSDKWEKTISNVFKFAKKGYYRIYAEDEDGNSNYVEFNVWNSSYSPVDGFTEKEFEMIERIYNIWPTLISKLRSEYPKLRNSSTWKNLSDEFYNNIRDVINKKSNREFKDYDDFNKAFTYWFSYTQKLMK